MGTHIGVTMKTTIEISDPLLQKARKLAAREGTTLRAIVEQGLRWVIEEAKQEKPFKLRDASVKGRGLKPELADVSWDEIRRLSYGDRSG
jgi:CRISPR/Cas system-associated protein Csm6